MLGMQFPLLPLRSAFRVFFFSKAGTITKAILEFLARLNIPIERVMGFVSDVASVIVGRRAGAATLLIKSRLVHTTLYNPSRRHVTLMVILLK